MTTIKQYAGQSKVSREIDAKVKKANSISEEYKEKKRKQQSIYFYTKLINKNKIQS